jgi:glycosyltransferase involved in cell wall biosynthesis
MNILFCKNNFAGPISGADEIAVNYAVELNGAGHQTAVLLVQPPLNSDPLAARLRAAGIPLVALASPKFTASLAFGRKIAIRAMRAFSPARRLILTNSRKIVFDLLQRYHDAFCEYLDEYKPSIVHVITPDPGAIMLITAAHSMGIPVVYQEVGIPFDPPGFEDVYQRFVSVLPLCSEIAALSPLLAKEMNFKLPHLREPLVLPLISSDVTNGALESAYQSETVRFGFAARLEHLKGPIQLVEGFKITHRSQPKVELKLAGQGSLRQQINLKLRKCGLEKKSSFVGTYTTVEERNRFMQDIDVFVLPSFTEGTPNAIIEAMAHGKPIIATKVGGIPDLVSKDTGFLVTPGDVKELGEAMTKLASDAELRKSMGKAARERYEQLFTPHVVLPLLTDFYKRVLNNGEIIKNSQALLTVESCHPWAPQAGNINAIAMHTGQ